MCLSLPGRVERLDGPRAMVEIAGARRWYNALMHPDLKVGDRVLVHAGLVLEVVEPEAARDMEALMLEMDELVEAADGG